MAEATNGRFEHGNGITYETLNTFCSIVSSSSV